MTRLLPTLFLLLLTLSSSVSTTPNATIYETLTHFGLPPGLFPNSVTSYSLDSETGRFTVDLTQPCYIHFDYLVYYDVKIMGTLKLGSITNLEGVKVRKLLIWFTVDEIRVDLPPSDSIYFHVGLFNRRLDVAQFETVRACEEDGVGGCSVLEMHPECQICHSSDHLADKPCPYLYTKCSIQGCDGLRVLKEAHTLMNNGRKFLKCQRTLCGGFKWLDEAIAEAQGFIGSSMMNQTPNSCFNCGGDDHWKKSCPWIGLKCIKCGGDVRIKASGQKQSEGRRYLNCGTCGKLDWFEGDVSKPTDTSKGNVKMTLEGSLEDFCYMMKNKMM